MLSSDFFSYVLGLCFGFFLYATGGDWTTLVLSVLLAFVVETTYNYYTRKDS